MHDADAMRGAKGIGNLNRDSQRLAERQCTLLQPVSQRLAVEQLHDEERRAVVFPDVVQRADVRVGQLRDRARFAIEARAEMRISSERVRENLDRHCAVEPRVAGLVDLAHPASAEGGENFVGAEVRLILVAQPLAAKEKGGTEHASRRRRDRHHALRSAPSPPPSALARPEVLERGSRIPVFHRCDVEVGRLDV